jgi:hypothetical protein
MTPDDALAFLVHARTQTYAAQRGRTEPLLDGSAQFEFSDGPWRYRDVYYQGNGLFPGLETVFHDGRPVFSLAYFGDFSRMSEGQADQMLQPALLALARTARTHVHVEEDFGTYRYVSAGQGSPGELRGLEEITVAGERVYWLRYAGGFIG